MFNAKTLLAPAALVSLLAAPALALDLSTDIKLAKTPEDMTTMKPVEGSAFVGNEVRTKDQIVIGQVENIYEGSDGNPVAVVTLNSDYQTKSSISSFVVPLAADMTADGSLTLGWTEGELVATLSGNLDAMGQDGQEAGENATKTDTDNSGG